jgi:hypothetical protein
LTTLLTHLTATFGPGTICRTSVRGASYDGEVRAYITVTRKEKI